MNTQNSHVPPPYMSQGTGTASGQSGYPSQSGYPGQSGYPQYATDQGNFPPQAAYPPQQNYNSGFIPSDNNQTTVPPSDLHIPKDDVYANSANDADYAKNFEFNTASIRRGFIRKVYGLLTIQLLVTFGFVLLFCLHEGVQAYMHKNLWILFVAVIVELVTIIALSCCEGVRRTHPINLIFMSIFTLSLSVLVGFIGSVYDVPTVLIAMGLTAFMSVGLSIFAIQTKWDFTKIGGGLFVALFLFTIIGIVAAILRSHYLELILAYVGVVLFSIYLIHDTQRIIGGNHKYKLNPEEYVMGAIALYLDIVEIFIYLLRIVGAAKN